MFHVEQLDLMYIKQLLNNKIYEMMLKLLIYDSKCAIIYIKNRTEREK